jgi:hypothetical protein
MICQAICKINFNYVRELQLKFTLYPGYKKYINQFKRMDPRLQTEVSSSTGHHVDPTRELHPDLSHLERLCTCHPRQYIASGREPGYSRWTYDR